MTSIDNPVTLDPSFAAAREMVRSGQLGQPLAVYAVARSRDALEDPLAVLGLPLIAEILAGVDEAPVSVTALANGAPGGLMHWSLIVAIESGLRASIDIGSGFDVAQESDLDIRLEWSGTDEVILVDPARVAVTIANDRGSRRASAEVIPIADAVFAFIETALVILSDPPAEWATTVAVIAAARQSAMENRPISISAKK